MAFVFSREDYERRIAWFTQARFGMFLHWGLYAIPARGEWVRSTERITAIRRLADGSEVPLSGSWVHSDYPELSFADLGPDPVLPDPIDTVLEARYDG